MLAKKFKKVTTEDGEVKFQPCFYKEDFIGENIVKMKYADLPENSLMARKVCYKDMMLALNVTILNNTIQSSDINPVCVASDSSIHHFRSFQLKLSVIMIFDMLDLLHC